MCIHDGYDFSVDEFDQEDNLCEACLHTRKYLSSSYSLILVLPFPLSIFPSPPSLLPFTDRRPRISEECPSQLILLAHPPSLPLSLPPSLPPSFPPQRTSPSFKTIHLIPSSTGLRGSIVVAREGGREGLKKGQQEQQQQRQQQRQQQQQQQQQQ